MKHGKGTQVWKKNGAIYEGDWKSGKRDGYGTLSLPDQETGKYKRVYSGWWKGDKKCGYGIQFFGPKEYYEGDWCGNQRSGWGRMYYSNGDIYEGQWHNDKPEGEGMLRLSQNSRSRRCVGGSLGHVQEDKRRRRLMPEGTPALQEEFKLESPNCSDRCGSCWRSKWGHTLGTLRRHLTPPSTGSFLPRRRPGLLSPAGPSLSLLPFSLDLISECTRIKEDPGGKSRVPRVGGGGRGGDVCAGSLGRDFTWRSEMSPWATWISLGAK
ncbi:MORN repeat-containing protein 3 isoform X2 [Oryx dammah]|nr:MORN repeat-containing protein 3 isoform X2 [Oryx dammah]